MKKPVTASLFLLLVFAVAAAGACLSSVLCRNKPPSHQDAHDWVHARLRLSSRQDAELEILEARYREKREGYERELSRANKELARAIRSDGKDSEPVNAAIGKIHSNMGELQMLTIGHVFEMKEVLSPEQYKKLLNFTADALDNIDSRHGGE
ncbi:MAG: periplasmic heavy metal sensor [Terrimicrobiaceae bacterium]|jgi:Spy/CpxP family protein refolding chaperone